MRKEKKIASWVVYKTGETGKVGGGVNVVCEQSEWEEMERAQPGHHTLIKDGIVSEAEAEKLARGTSGDALKSGFVKKVS
jgi:hypothetical protein